MELSTVTPLWRLVEIAGGYLSLKGPLLASHKRGWIKPLRGMLARLPLVTN
jgi:hypothetical protein